MTATNVFQGMGSMDRCDEVGMSCIRFECNAVWHAQRLSTLDSDIAGDLVISEIRIQMCQSAEPRPRQYILKTIWVDSIFESRQSTRLSGFERMLGTQFISDLHHTHRWNSWVRLSRSTSSETRGDYVLHGSFANGPGQWNKNEQTHNHGDCFAPTRPPNAVLDCMSMSWHRLLYCQLHWVIHKVRGNCRLVRALNEKDSTPRSKTT